MRPYAAWYGPFAQRAWMGLLHKGLAFEDIEVDPYRRSRWWLDIPRGRAKVPVIGVSAGSSGRTTTVIGLLLIPFAHRLNALLGHYRNDTASAAARKDIRADIADGGWSGKPIAFPRIQGADCCGKILAVGAEIPTSRIGERVLVRALQSTGASGDLLDTRTFGSDCDGAFAQFTKTFAADALPIRSDWTDLELASIPCAYSTAEAMLQKIGLGAERVLVTGASGGVGLAAVQLARRRGARVTAMTTADKAGAIRAAGADATISRDEPLGPGVFDAVVDVVAGARWPEIIDALRCGGRYVTAGAIAGPIVELDVRTLYLRDLTLYGSTFQPDNIFEDLVGYIERGELRPQIARAFDLKDIHQAQTAFLDKRHVGKIVIRVAG